MSASVNLVPRVLSYPSLRSEVEQTFDHLKDLLCLPFLLFWFIGNMKQMASLFWILTKETPVLPVVYKSRLKLVGFLIQNLREITVARG